MEIYRRGTRVLSNNKELYEKLLMKRLKSFPFNTCHFEGRMKMLPCITEFCMFSLIFKGKLKSAILPHAYTLCTYVFARLTIRF